MDGENSAAQQAWSQREACQQGQHEEAFCYMRRCHCHLISVVSWPVLDKQLAQPSLQGLCQMHESDLELSVSTI